MSEETPMPAAAASTHEPRPPRDRAVEAGYPPDSGPEQSVLKTHACMFRAAPIRFSAMGLIVLLGLVFGLICLLGREGTWWTILGWLLIAAAVGAKAALVVWKIQTMGHVLRITNKRTVTVVGIFSKATSEVVHDNIRNVQIDQNFWQRVWNVGTLGISSAGQGDIEVKMTDVPRPHEIAKIIDLYRPLG